MTSLRGIIFDKDGTLFDFASTWSAWARAFLHRVADDGVEAAHLGRVIGYDLETGRFDAGSVVIAGTPAEIADCLAPHLAPTSRARLIAMLNEEAGAAPQVEAAPLGPLLRDLRADGLRLGVVTNDAEAPARAHLQRAGVEQAFDFIAGFDSGFGCKPGPDPLLAFAEAMGLVPADVLMVGDSLHDLHAARAAGMRAVAVLTGVAGKEVLAPHAEAVLPHIGHLPAWLARG